MSNEKRERLNLRAIRVSLDSGLRYVPPDRRREALERAIELALDARRHASTKAIQRDAEALHGELKRLAGDRAESGK